MLAMRERGSTAEEDEREAGCRIGGRRAERRACGPATRTTLEMPRTVSGAPGTDDPAAVFAAASSGVRRDALPFGTKACPDDQFTRPNPCYARGVDLSSTLVEHGPWKSDEPA